MKLIYEYAKERQTAYLPAPRKNADELIDASFLRAEAPHLPQISENTLSRHYSALSKRTFGVNCGFYPLGSCTMKYNPKLSLAASELPGFAELHPTQKAPGALTLLGKLSEALCEVCGMDAFTLQPAAGAHGELTGLLMIRAYLNATGQSGRTKVLVPDSAHGTNPASATMAGFTVVNIPSAADGGVDLVALGDALDDSVAALMLTNPNTLGLFDRNILKITEMVHASGALCYYDGANLNAIMGIARPGDMGFDVMHVNLHKTFAAPHGGGGAGSGPVGCVKKLAAFLPSPLVQAQDGAYAFVEPEHTIGRMKAFYGNFSVIVKAYCYLITLGAEGLRNASQTAVLNANYFLALLSTRFEAPYGKRCMHEFVLSLQDLKDKTGVSALDFAKGLLERGMHPPTMYFPLIVHEALMPEPTETENRAALEEAANIYIELLDKALEAPDSLHDSPHPGSCAVCRPDEVQAARKPILRYHG